MRWGSGRTDAPRIFHLSNAIALVATAIDRNRWLAFQHKRVYPNVFLLNIAGSGDRKSTPMGYAKEALAAAYPKRLLSNDYSPEALIADLAARGDCSRGTAFMDEAGRILGTMRKGGYGEGLKDLLSELWDGPELFTRTLRGEAFTLRSVYINLVMATTNSRFLETVSSEDVTSGFFARFLPFVVIERVERRRLSLLTGETKSTGDALYRLLAEMGARLEDPSAISITRAAVDRLDAAEQAIEEWAGRQYHGDLIVPWSKRLAEYASRLAIVFAISEGVEEIRVGMFCGRWTSWSGPPEDMASLVRQLLSDRREREIERLRQYIEKNPGISRRDICRNTDLRSDQVADYAAVLRSRDKVMIQSSGRVGALLPGSAPAGWRWCRVSGVGSTGKGEGSQRPADAADTQHLDGRRRSRSSRPVAEQETIHADDKKPKFGHVPGTSPSDNRINSGSKKGAVAYHAVVPVPPRLLELEDAAAYLGVSTWTYWGWRAPARCGGSASRPRVAVICASCYSTETTWIPFLFPHLSGRHMGERINDFRKAWTTACRKAGVPGRLRMISGARRSGTW